MANRTVRLLVGLAGAASAVLMLWLAYDELTREGGDTWLALVLISIVPTMVGLGHTIPEFLRARDPNERTRVVAAPFLSVCMAITVFLLAITAGLYIGGWKGALLGGAVGTILAAQGIASMRFLRRTLDRPVESLPPTSGKPSTQQIAWVVAKLLLFLTASFIFLAGFGYLLFGRVGAIVLGCVSAGINVFLSAQAFHQIRRRKADGPAP